MNDERYYGKYRGRVVDPIDRGDATKGRIVAQVTLGGKETEVVAEACVPAGIGTGLYTIPPKDAGVWIEFEEGDRDKPVWTGGWWNDRDLGTSFGKLTKLDNQPLILQSVNGQRVILDRDKITISFGENGPSIELDSSSVSIKAGQCSLVINSTEIKLNGDNLKVEL